MLVHELLTAAGVLQPCEAVVAPALSEPRLVQLAGQPFAAVDTGKDAKRKPGLDARVHEAEQRMALVVIQIQAFPLAVLDLELVAGVILVDLEGHARLDTLEDRAQSLANPVAGRDLLGQRFFVGRAAPEVFERPACLLGQRRGGRNQTCRDRLAVLLELLVLDAIGPQIMLQTSRAGKVPQRPPKKQAIKPAENSSDKMRKAAQKGIPGVPPGARDASIQPLVR